MQKFSFFLFFFFLVILNIYCSYLNSARLLSQEKKTETVITKKHVALTYLFEKSIRA